MKKILTFAMLLLLSGLGINTAAAQASAADTASISSTDFTSKAWQETYGSKPKAKARKTPFYRRIEIQPIVPQDTQSLMAWTAKFNGEFAERMNRRLAQGNWWEPNDSLYSSFTFSLAPFTLSLHGIGYDF